MDAARQLDVAFGLFCFFVLLVFFLHDILMLLGPTEESAPRLVVSDLQLAEHIVVGDLQMLSLENCKVRNIST